MKKILFYCKKSKVFFVAICFFTPSFSFAASNNQDDARERCNGIGNEIGATYNANDFSSLKNLAQWVIKNCRSYLARDAFYEYFASLAVAERELGNLKDALQVAIDCIERRYGLPACHLEEYFSLKALGKHKMADVAGRRFESLVRQGIANLQDELRKSTSKSLQHELLESKLDLYRAMLGAYLRDAGQAQ